MSCNLAEIHKCFRETCCLHFQGGKISFSDGSVAFFHCRRVIFLSPESGGCKFDVVLTVHSR